MKPLYEGVWSQRGRNWRPMGSHRRSWRNSSAGRRLARDMSLRSVFGGFQSVSVRLVTIYADTSARDASAGPFSPIYRSDGDWGMSIRVTRHLLTSKVWRKGRSQTYGRPSAQGGRNPMTTCGDAGPNMPKCGRAVRWTGCAKFWRGVASRWQPDDTTATREWRNARGCASPSSPNTGGCGSRSGGGDHVCWVANGVAGRNHISKVSAWI